MEAALGPLGWSPSEFWAATPIDLAAAIRGNRRSQGSPDLTDDDRAELRNLLERDARGEFDQKPAPARRARARR